MEIEKSPTPHHRIIKDHLKLFIFLIFIGIFGILIYSSFYGLPSTGNVITGGAIGVNENTTRLKFNAELNVPDLNLEGNFKKIEMLGSSKSFFTVGDQKFNLGNNSNNYLIFNDFVGEISTKANTVMSMKGKASRVTVNGIIVSSQSRDTTKVNFEGGFNFNSLEIKDKVIIRKLEYKTSGIIRLNEEKNIFNLDNEEISIEGFIGDLTIENSKSKFDGNVRKLDIKGDSKISIFS